MRTIAVLFAFALVTSTTYLSGQQPAAATSAQSAATSQDYSAESVVVEKLSTVYRFAADGTGSREMTAVIRIQSDAAARQYGVLDFSFASNNERVEIDYVRVRKPDGSLIETPAGDAQEMPLEVTRQAPFYSDLKQKQVPVRNLRMGDKLEYKVRVVDTTAEVPGQFWGQESFGRWAVILNQAVELHVPKSKYVKVWSPSTHPAKNETADEITYLWTGSQLTPVAPKDSPLKHLEFDPKGELPTVAWTTFKSWDEVGTWYRSLEADRIVPDATVKAKVAELTAGKTSEEEKAHVLYSYVATQIRYIGVAFGIGRYQPHPAAEVMRNQYGDCKDKHTLLAAMLTAAGLHPSASMIGPGIRLNEEVPSPAAFNHMITMVPMNGKQVWLDTTAEVAPWGLLVASTRDKETLVVPDSGTPKLEKTPQALPFTPISRFESKGTLSKEGTLKARIEYTARGDDEILLRSLLRQVPPGQWDDLSQRLAQGMGFSGTTSHTEAGNPDKTDEPIHISYDYEREKTGNWDNHRIVAHMPVLYVENVDDKYPPKKYAIQLGEPHIETSVSVIKLPPGWGAQLPEVIHQKTPYIALDKTYKVEGDTLTVERKFEVLQREFPAAEWKSYKSWYDKAIGDGEPYINLISTESKTATGSATPAMPKQEIAVILRAFYEQIQRGELNAAEQSMNQVQQLEPNSIWYYRCLYQLQALKGKPEEAADALRHVLKTNDAIDAEKKAGAETFYLLGHYEEALPLLEAQSSADPENETLKLHLGISQMKTGSTGVGSKTLVALLDKTTEESTMNSAAYELAEGNVELEKAEKAARSVVDTLTAESTSWVVSGASTKMQQQRESLLIATWDTLGWIFYREGRLAEAENYIRAAWNNEQGPEGGLHLGEIEEKLGNQAAAMGIYEIALATIPPSNLGTVSPATKQQKQKLDERVAALKKQGVASQSATPNLALQKMRTMKLGLWKGKNALAEYAFTIENGRTGDLQESNPGAAPIVGANAMMRKATFNHWIPAGSNAHLLRKGTLNCHSGVCELVVHPM